MILRVNEAVELADKRGLVPTWLNTAEIREAMTRDLRARSVFSAQTTSARYLGKMKEVISLVVSGDLSEVDGMVALRLALANLGYSADTGFPEDGGGQGEEGAITDLASDVRLRLIVRTQRDVLFGQARKIREASPERTVIFPAWEYVRKESRKEVRNWQMRWEEAGGELIDGRMLAWKWDAVWERLGDSSLFSDGLDTGFAPYAFNSGMGMVERSRAVAERFLGPMAAAQAVAPGLDLSFETGLEGLSKEQLEAVLAESGESGLAAAQEGDFKRMIEANEAALAGPNWYEQFQDLIDDDDD